MDALDEINAEVEKLCVIAERQRERVLDELIRAAFPGALYTGGSERSDVAELALDYANWTHSLEGYRSLLRRGDTPIARVK